MELPLDSQPIFRDVQTIRRSVRKFDRETANYWYLQTLAWAAKHNIPFGDALGTLYPGYGYGNVIRRSSGGSLTRTVPAVEALHAGVTLGDVVKHGNLPPYCVRIIQEAEAEGLLPQVLPELAAQAKLRGNSAIFLRKMMVISAAALFIYLVFIAGLFLLIVPGVSVVYRDLVGVEVPTSFQIVSDLSMFAVDHVIIIVIILLLGAALLFKLHKYLLGTRVLESAILLLPVLGKLYWRTRLRELAWSMSVALSAGKDIVEAVAWSRRVISSHRLKRQLECVHEGLRLGERWDAAWLGSIRSGPTEEWIILNAAGREDPLGGFRMLAETLDGKVQSTSVAIVRVVGPFKDLMMVGIMGLVAYSIINVLFTLVSKLS